MSYVIQGRSQLGELNDLDTRVCPCRDGCALWDFDLGETERAVAGLVEGGNEGDVEDDGVVAANTQVHVCDCPWVGGREGERASVNGPFGPVGCYVDSAAYICIVSIRRIYVWHGMLGYEHGLVYCVLKESPRQ